MSRTKVAFQGEDKTIPRKLAIDFFIKGLRHEIRKAIRRLPDTDDFESVVANAEKESRILDQERKEDHRIIENLNSLAIADMVDTLEEKINSLAIPRPPRNQFPNQNRNFRGRSNQPQRRNNRGFPVQNQPRYSNRPRQPPQGRFANFWNLPRYFCLPFR